MCIVRQLGLPLAFHDGSATNLWDDDKLVALLLADGSVSIKRVKKTASMDA
jgi:hypothetical protein